MLEVRRVGQDDDSIKDTAGLVVKRKAFRGSKLRKASARFAAKVNPSINARNVEQRTAVLLAVENTNNSYVKRL